MGGESPLGLSKCTDLGELETLQIKASCLQSGNKDLYILSVIKSQTIKTAWLTNPTGAYGLNI